MAVSGPDTVPAFPSIEPGITHLATAERAMGALHSVVLDDLLATDGGEALWVDAHGNAQTQQLASTAPSMRVLERIMVARAFTPFQHYSLVETLAERVSPATSLVVLPAVDWFYTTEDLRRGEPGRLAGGVAATLEQLVEASGVPVLLTRAGRGHWAAFDDVVGRTIQCELTSEGPRFSGEEFETLVYHENGYLQTTFAYWRQVLADRHDIDAPVGPRQEVSSGGPY